MPDQLQLRGGTTAEHSTFTGASKEVTVDTTKKTAVVHDGTTAGGIPLLRQDGNNSALALGSEGTPSLKWDANTGIFSPGEDQLAIVTGANRAITCTSTQAVGIKTANPNAALHVAGSTRVGADSAADAFLEIGEGATGNRNSYIDIVGDTTYTDYGLRVIRNNTGANATSELKHRGTGALNFTTEEAAPIVFYTTNSPSMTITSGGLVGIGTSTPTNTSKLEIQTSSTTAPGLWVQTGGTTSAYPIVDVRNGANLDVFAIKGDGTSYFQGKLGIGTTTPSAKLHVNTGTDENLWVGSLGGSGAGVYLASVNDSTSTNQPLQIGSASVINFAISGTPRATIDSSGRLLVGTIASPAHQLQVSTDSAGKPSTNTWTIVSDERIKEEIELADLDLCYQAVKNIPLKRFKWKDEVYTEEQVRDRRKLGWIAQDVEAVFPKAVGTYEFKYNQVFEETIIPAIEEELDGEGNVTTPAQPERIGKGELISEDVIEDCRDLNSDQLYAAMYGAIQKLMVKVETLETELAALKAS